MKDYNYKFDQEGRLKDKIDINHKNRNIIFVENLFMFLTVLSVLGCVLFLFMRGVI